jgi:hypothetical protein
MVSQVKGIIQLQMFENTELRRISGPDREEVRGHS